MKFAGKIGILLYAASVMGGCSYPSDIEHFDESNITPMQLTQMQEGEEIAVITTTHGKITLRFFPSEAPDSMDIFIDMSEKGSYNGQALFVTQDDDDEFAAVQPKNTDETSYEAEVSYNLCPVSGAVAMYVDAYGKADGSFFIHSSNSITAEDTKELHEDGFPKIVAQVFGEMGGYPDRWLKDAVFAQVIEGQDIIDKIADGDIEDEKVIIENISIEKYEA